MGNNCAKEAKVYMKVDKLSKTGYCITVVGIVVVSAIIGILLIVASYMLPADTIKANVERGAYILLLQGAEYEYSEGYTSTILDNETDAVILSETVYSSDSPIENAVNVPRMFYPDNESQVNALFSYFHDDPDGFSMDYPRYWHGYLMILKPFFMLFDYSDLRVMNQALQLVLIVITLILMLRNDLGSYLLAFVPMLIYWNPATIGVSLQYAPCFYLSVLGSILVLSGEIREGRPMMLFFQIGGGYSRRILIS